MDEDCDCSNSILIGICISNNAVRDSGTCSQETVFLSNSICNIHLPVAKPHQRISLYNSRKYLNHLAFFKARFPKVLSTNGHSCLNVQIEVCREGKIRFPPTTSLLIRSLRSPQNRYILLLNGSRESFLVPRQLTISCLFTDRYSL